MPIVRCWLAVVALFATGWTCNDGDTTDAEEIPAPPPESSTPPGAAPANFGSWLSLGVAADGAAITMSSYDRAAGAVDFAIGTPGTDGAVSFSHEKVDGYPIADSATDPGD